MEFSMIIYEKGPLGKEVKEIKSLGNITQSEAEQENRKAILEGNEGDEVEVVEGRKSHGQTETMNLIAVE